MKQAEEIKFATDETASSSQKGVLEKFLFLEEPKTVLGNLGSSLFVLILILIVYTGWTLRSREYLTAESGVGYALGVIGVGLMLVLLIYPLRKRIKALSAIGSVKFWFKFHMLLGVVVPACILFHANFQLGSTNSRVALFSMIVVAVSGVVGRFFYKRIHYGLFGRRARMKELRDFYDSKKGEVTAGVDFAPQISRELLGFCDRLINQKQGFIRSFFRSFFMGINIRFMYRKLGKACKEELTKSQRDKKKFKKDMSEAKSRIWVFLACCRKVAEFSFYEKVFSIWHVLHLPLFVMLFLSGIFHVVAVHAY